MKVILYLSFFMYLVKQYGKISKFIDIQYNGNIKSLAIVKKLIWSKDIEWNEVLNGYIADLTKINDIKAIPIECISNIIVVIPISKKISGRAAHLIVELC